MDKWIFVIDVKKCEDCNCCFLSCKDEYIGNDFPPYSVAQPKHGHRWMNIKRKERGQCPMVDVAYLPTPCMHCDNAPCIKKAKGGSVYKSHEGIVIIDPEKAKGQKGIVDTCPYGVIWWNEEKQVAQKCTLCAHLLKDGWKQPRCVQSCPTGALTFARVEDSRIEQIIKDEHLEALRPDFNTGPRVFYQNLYRFNRCFIGGSVAIQVAGITDCVEGATVTLYKDSEKVADALTDNYGDFKFDNLEENSGRYRLDIDFKGYGRKTIEVELTDSKNVGTIQL